MDAVAEVAKDMTELSAGQLTLIVALAAIVVAGFAIYAVHSIAKERGKDR